MLLKHVFALFLSIMPTVLYADYLDDNIVELVKLKQEKITTLEKCQKSKGGLMAAGIATLGVSAIGIGANIGEAIALKKLDADIATQKIEINNLEIQINQKRYEIDNTCGKPDSCTDSAEVAAKTLNAQDVVCINGTWKIKQCIPQYYAHPVHSCTRNGDNVFYYEECMPVGKDGRNGRDGRDGIVVIQRIGSNGEVVETTEAGNQCGVSSLIVEQGNSTVVQFSDNQTVTISEGPDSNVATAVASGNTLTLTSVGVAGNETKLKVNIANIGDCEYQVKISQISNIKMHIKYGKTNSLSIGSETVELTSECPTKVLEVEKGGATTLTYDFGEGYSIVEYRSDTPNVVGIDKENNVITLSGVGNIDETAKVTIKINNANGQEVLNCALPVKIVSASNVTIGVTQKGNNGTEVDNSTKEGADTNPKSTTEVVGDNRHSESHKAITSVDLVTSTVYDVKLYRPIGLGCGGASRYYGNFQNGSLMVDCIVYQSAEKNLYDIDLMLRLVCYDFGLDDVYGVNKTTRKADTEKKWSEVSQNSLHNWSTDSCKWMAIGECKKGINESLSNRIKGQHNDGCLKIMRTTYPVTVTKGNRFDECVREISQLQDLI
ncbi:MAG: hypothetical protein IKZ34_01990 [Alphaproteobacteria bacterium]|nr:hypothetical protein [Alphaproteobacteria bacterium]